MKKNRDIKQKKVNIVIIDDDQTFTNALVDYFRMKNKNLVVDKYYHPKKFLEKISLYAKDTHIIIDYNFKNIMNGIDLANILYNNGYTKLCLLSGKDFKKGEYPNYVTVLLKGDMISLDKLIYQVCRYAHYRF
jgi:hypothetical protein